MHIRGFEDRSEQEHNCFVLRTELRFLYFEFHYHETLYINSIDSSFTSLLSFMSYHFVVLIMFKTRTFNPVEEPYFKRKILRWSRGSLSIGLEWNNSGRTIANSGFCAVQEDIQNRTEIGVTERIVFNRYSSTAGAGDDVRSKLVRQRDSW